MNNGNYWHCNPDMYERPKNKMQEEQIEEDKIRTKELKEVGYRVIRLWECDIKKMEINNFKNIINVIQ